MKEIPRNIIGINRTENQQELAGLYTTADVFFNPTYEDNYPTVNLEAIACGTPVITYDTGGSPEFTKTFNSNKEQYIIKKDIISNNYISILNKIKIVFNKKNIVQDISKLGQSYMINQYLNIYK